VRDLDGTLSGKKRNAADMLAGTTYVPTGPTGAAAAAASAAAQQQRRIAAERRAAQVSTATVRGNVTSHSNISAEDDGNMDVCYICGDMGTLLCCDLCPLSYHADCAGLSTIPQGFWRSAKFSPTVACHGLGFQHSFAFCACGLILSCVTTVLAMCFVFFCVSSCPQCTSKNLSAAAMAAAAASGGARAGAGSAAVAANAALLAAKAQAAAQGLGMGVQGGLDPFHQRLNACLDYSAAECYEVDGYTFQTFPPPLDPNSKAAKDKAAKAAALAIAPSAATASSSPQAPAASSPVNAPGAAASPAVA
jgi:hypothetical protein